MERKKNPQNYGCQLGQDLAKSLGAIASAESKWLVKETFAELTNRLELRENNCLLLDTFYSIIDYQYSKKSLTR